LGLVAVTPMSLFPLSTVLFPGAGLPLHVFERRYRDLIEDILTRTDGFREFGVVAIRAGREVGAHGVESLHPVGCTAEVLTVQPFTDGSFDILTRGARRFRIREVLPPAPDTADRADLDFLTESPSARSRDLAESTARLFVRYRRAVLAAQGFPADSPFTLPDDPVGCSYTVAAAMALDLTDRQRLLEAPTVDDRLTLAGDLLRREIGLVGRLSTRAGEELARGGWSPN
jgi:Lon protease-like protein